MSFSAGITPFSESRVAFTITMNRIVFLLDLEPGSRANPPGGKTSLTLYDEPGHAKSTTPAIFFRRRTAADVSTGDHVVLRYTRGNSHAPFRPPPSRSFARHDNRGLCVARILQPFQRYR